MLTTASITVLSFALCSRTSLLSCGHRLPASLPPAATAPSRARPLPARGPLRQVGSSGRCTAAAIFAAQARTIRREMGGTPIVGIGASR